MFVTLTYFRQERFVQFLSLVTIQLFFLYFLVLKSLVYTGIPANLEDKKRNFFLI